MFTLFYDGNLVIASNVANTFSLAYNNNIRSLEGQVSSDLKTLEYFTLFFPKTATGSRSYFFPYVVESKWLAQFLLYNSSYSYLSDYIFTLTKSLIVWFTISSFSTKTTFAIFIDFEYFCIGIIGPDVFILCYSEMKLRKLHLGKYITCNFIAWYICCKVIRLQPNTSSVNLLSVFFIVE